MMRLAQYQIKALAAEVVTELDRRRLVRFNLPLESAAAAAEKAIADDLSVEDRLNEEVKELLKAYGREIEQGKVDYKTMFDLVKKKLVRERGLVL